MVAQLAALTTLQIRGLTKYRPGGTDRDPNWQR